MRRILQIIALHLVVTVMSLSAAELEGYYPSESALLIDMQKYNALKRASFRSNGDRFVVWTGGVGSGFRVFNTFIFRRSGDGFVLAFQDAFDSTRQGVRTAAIFPDIHEEGITLFAQTRDGDHEISRVSFDTLRERTERAEQGAAANP